MNKLFIISKENRNFANILHVNTVANRISDNRSIKNVSGVFIYKEWAYGLFATKTGLQVLFTVKLYFL
jgi:hypothetical protein